MAEEAMELAQPQDLFCESMLPVRPDLELMVRERSFLPEKRPDSARFSGKIVIRKLMNDVELCEAICAALLMGLSARIIGKRFTLSPRSVVNIRQAMADRGELAPVRLRIQAKLDRVIELGLERWEEGILDGSIHPGQIPIPTLAAIDKKGQLEAGVVPGTDVTEGEAQEAKIRAAWLALELARAAASDPQSTAAEAHPIDITPRPAADVAPDTELDTPPAALNVPSGVTLDLPLAPAAVPVAAGTPEGRGGDRPSSPGPDARGVGPENFQP